MQQALIRRPSTGPYDQEYHEKLFAHPCKNCGARDLGRRHTARWFHKLFCIYPYRCPHCFVRQAKFQFSFFSIFVLLFLVAVAGAASYVRNHRFHPIDDGTGNTAESLVRARASAGGLSAFEEMSIHKSRLTLDNATVLKLWKAKVPYDVILRLIHSSVPDYDISASAIIQLNQEGVDQSLILAMIDVTYSAR